MPGKMARSAPQPAFGLPEVLVAVHTSRLSCRKAGKAQIFAPVWESSGESRFKGGCACACEMCGRTCANNVRKCAAPAPLISVPLRRSAARERNDFLTNLPARRCIRWGKLLFDIMKQPLFTLFHRSGRTENGRYPHQKCLRHRIHGRQLPCRRKRARGCPLS